MPLLTTFQHAQCDAERTAKLIEKIAKNVVNDAMTDTATSTTAGLMSASDKSKLDGIDLSNYVQKDGSKVLSTNDYTTAEKNKLSGIASNAQENVIESVKVNGTALPVTNKAVNITTNSQVVLTTTASTTEGAIWLEW